MFEVPLAKHNFTRRSALIFATGALATSSFVRPAFSASDGPFEDLLRRYVSPHRDGINRVDYRRWHASEADRATLGAYIKALEGARPSALSRDARFAYWANLYNSVTLKVILDNYPVKSIRDIRSQTSVFDVKGYIGPWRTKLVNIEGKEMSLDDIENVVMRPQFSDPRVHYSINCASLGCPNLPTRPWRAGSLNQDLDHAARAFINHRRGVEVKADGSLKISSIFRWFKEDFGADDQALITHFKRYADETLQAKLSPSVRISEDGYDWKLNQPGAEAS